MLVYLARRSLAVTSSPNVFYFFYLNSKKKGDGSVANALRAICGKLVSEEITPGDMEYLLKGLNNYAWEAKDIPQVWQALQTNFDRDKKPYSPRTTALLLNVIWRKRLFDPPFLQATLSFMKPQIPSLDPSSTAWLCEAFARFSSYVSPQDISALETALLANQANFTPQQAKVICMSVRHMAKKFQFSLPVYECLTKLVGKVYKELSLHELAQCLNSLAYVDFNFDLNLFSKVQSHIVGELQKREFDPDTLSILLNAYCQVYPTHNFQPFFVYCEQFIVSNPEPYLSNPTSYCSLVHCYGKVRVGEAIFEKFQQYAFTMYRQKDAKALGVTLANLLRHRVNKKFLEEKMKPMFLDVANTLTDIHRKKCLLFLLSLCPDDTEFWDNVRAKVTINLTQSDAVHFKPVAGVMKARLGIELSGTQPVS